MCVFCNAPRWLLVKSSRKAEARAQAREWYGGKETTIPSVVLVWATSYFLFLSLCGQYDCLLWTLVEMLGDVKKVPTCPFNKGKSWWRENGTIGGSRVMRPGEELSQDFCKNHFFKSRGGGSAPKCEFKAVQVGQNAGQRISLHFPFFMYLWHAIKLACLDSEITPCLPTNKPPALLSGPLFIIHNLLWCQGQSDSIVMVKGTSADPELSTGVGNPGIQTNKKRNPRKSDGLDCNQRSAKDL